MIANIIIVVLWCLMATTLLVEYAPECKKLNEKDRLLVILIFLIGAPAFTLVNFLTAVLDGILPDGWDD
jgi:hypothetical protein